MCAMRSMRGGFIFRNGEPRCIPYLVKESLLCSYAPPAFHIWWPITLRRQCFIFGEEISSKFVFICATTISYLVFAANVSYLVKKSHVKYLCVPPAFDTCSGEKLLLHLCVLPIFHTWWRLYYYYTILLLLLLLLLLLHTWWRLYYYYYTTTTTTITTTTYLVTCALPMFHTWWRITPFVLWATILDTNWCFIFDGKIKESMRNSCLIVTAKVRLEYYINFNNLTKILI